MQFLFRKKASRRRFLGLSVLGALTLNARGAFGAVIGPGRRARDPLKSLPAFLDTLLPADEVNLSASAVGLSQKVVNGVKSRRGQRFLGWGCAWLDREARRLGAADFTVLSQPQRDAIVARAEAAPHDRGEYIFFDSVRADAFRHYYSDARSWPSVDYDGPPQPAGFPDHASPPISSR